MDSRVKYAIALSALTLVVLGLRLLVCFQEPNPGYESYFTLLQADHIRATGLPLTNDPYGFGGRRLLFAPGYYYLVAGIGLLLPTELVVRLLPNLCMAALIPIVFFLCLELTKSRWASLAAAAFAGFSPVLFTSYLNTAIPLSLALPLCAALLLALLHIEHNPWPALVLTTLLTLVSPLIWLVLGMYLLYMLILLAERMRIDAASLEASFFMLLLASWLTLLLFKDALHRYGYTFLSGSMPQALRAATFSDFTFLAAVYAVGVVPLLLGSLAIYQVAFEARTRRVFFLSSFALMALIAGALRLLPLRTALVVVSLAFVILSAPALFLVGTYLEKTRLSLNRRHLVAVLALVFLLTSVLPAIAAGIYAQRSPSPAELDAVTWLRTSTPADAVVLTAPRSGFLVNREAQRRYVADEQYLLIANPDEILADIDTIYTTPRTVEAAELLAAYRVTHIMVGPTEHARYTQLGALTKDPACFPLLYQNNQVLIYGVHCAPQVIA